jgi:ABC-type sugar transport system permease subunit
MNRNKNTKLYGGHAIVLVTVGPALTLFTIFVGWPAIDAFFVSLASWTGYSPRSEFIGLSNYRALIDDKHFWRSLFNTLYYVVLGGIFHLSLAFLFAGALHNPRFRGKNFFQSLIFFPSFISVVAIGVMWTLLYEPHSGLFNRVLSIAGIDGPIWLSPKHGMNAIIVVSIWAGVGSHMIIILAGLRRIPTHILSAARLDGASELAIFWYVILPMLRNVTYAVMALWLIGAMQVFGLIQVLVPYTPELQSVSTYHYGISFNARDNIYMMGRGTAMAVVLLVTIMFLVGIVRLAFGRTQLEY